MRKFVWFRNLLITGAWYLPSISDEIKLFWFSIWTDHRNPIRLTPPYTDNVTHAIFIWLSTTWQSRTWYAAVLSNGPYQTYSLFEKFGLCGHIKGAVLQRKHISKKCQKTILTGAKICKKIRWIQWCYPFWLKPSKMTCFWRFSFLTFFIFFIFLYFGVGGMRL